jgi:hypothetical protein
VRVDWVHPSWRDLVIEQLAADPWLRRRFLRRCGIDGAALALSGAGGAAGERVRPLLLEDADWDALGDGMHHLCEEIDRTGAVRLLRVLEDARDGPEAEALTALVLSRIERRFDCTPVGVELLEAWGDIAGRLPPPATVAATWFELVPDAAPVTPVELERFADWLRLAELVQRWDASLLARFGFPAGFDAIFDAFLEGRPVDEPPIERDLRADARLRIGRLVSGREIAVLEFDFERLEPPALVRQLDPPRVETGFAVDRVLRDLVE